MRCPSSWRKWILSCALSLYTRWIWSKSWIRSTIMTSLICHMSKISGRVYRNRCRSDVSIMSLFNNENTVHRINQDVEEMQGDSLISWCALCYVIVMSWTRQIDLWILRSSSRPWITHLIDSIEVLDAHFDHPDYVWTLFAGVFQMFISLLERMPSLSDVDALLHYANVRVTHSGLWLSSCTIPMRTRFRIAWFQKTPRRCHCSWREGEGLCRLIRVCVSVFWTRFRAIICRSSARETSIRDSSNRRSSGSVT